LRIDVFYHACRSGDAGVVDQRVEATQPGVRCVEECVHVSQGGDVGAGGPRFGAPFREFFEGPLVHITDVYSGATVDECLGDSEADPRGARRDHDPQAFHRYVHANSLQV
jgi:hypothetical protein